MVVHGQQQREDMHMAATAHRLRLVLRKRGYVRRVWSHDRIAMLLAGTMTLTSVPPQSGKLDHTVMCGCLGDGMRIGAAGQLRW